jgi:FKBP-type peptidyl-prolyl cis-trans isomerase FkpA
LKHSFAVLLVLLLAACGGDSSSSPTPPDNTGGITSLQVEDLVVGTGATAASGDTVTVDYTGTLLNGTVFDTSVGKTPLTFRLGANAVIPGFDQGVTGMKVGGKRRLTIPPSLAYGASGNGPIPPNSTIRFEVDLLSIAGK